MTNIPLCDDDNNEDDVVCLKIGRNYLHLGTQFLIVGHKIGLHNFHVCIWVWAMYLYLAYIFFNEVDFFIDLILCEISMCPRAHLYTVCGLRCLSLHVEAHTNEHTHTTSSTLLMEVLWTGDIFECFIKGLQNGTNFLTKLG